MRKGWILGMMAMMSGMLSCDQRTNPLNPDAIITVKNVEEINTRVELDQQLVTLPDGTSIFVCSITVDPERVVVTFQEEYGGQWATVYQYRVEYLDPDGNPLGVSPLWGTTSVRIPPLGEGAVSVGLMTDELLNLLLTGTYPSIKAKLELWVRGDYQGESMGGGLDYHFTFYHDMFVSFNGCD